MKNSYGTKKIMTYLLLLLIVLLGVFTMGLLMGTVKITPLEIYHILLNDVSFDTVLESGLSYEAGYDIIWHLRLPRLFLAICVGVGLSDCGVVMQAAVRNPLADPYILGISSGAALGANLAIFLGIGRIFGANFIGVLAFLGALGVSFAVILISNIGGRSNTIKLLLSGMALNAVCSALSSSFVYFFGDPQKIQQLTFWLMGSLSGANWENLAFLIPLILLGNFFFWSQSRVLNLMLVGEDVALTLGVNLHRYRQLYLIVSSLLIGFLVYSSGMIGFVGLMIPHVTRMLIGNSHWKVIPFSALIGAIFIVGADILCRSLISKGEIPIGLLISLLGAPCFIYLIISKSYGFGGNRT